MKSWKKYIWAPIQLLGIEMSSEMNKKVFWECAFGRKERSEKRAKYTKLRKKRGEAGQGAQALDPPVPNFSLSLSLQPLAGQHATSQIVKLVANPF